MHAARVLHGYNGMIPAFDDHAHRNCPHIPASVILAWAGDSFTPVGGALCSIDQLVCQALGHSLDVAESRLAGAGGQQVDRLGRKKGTTECKTSSKDTTKDSLSGFFLLLLMFSWNTYESLSAQRRLEF